MKSFVSLFFIAISVTVFIVVIRPQYDKLKEIKEEVKLANENLETAGKLMKSRDELLAKYQSVSKTDLDNLKTLLPDSVDNIRLIIQINSFADKNGLSILKDIDYKVEQMESDSNGEDAMVASLPYGEFVISFQTSGKYKDFLAFVADLERNLRLVDLVKVDFMPAEGESVNSNNIGYKVALKTYWLKQ